jgi:hypothetical protein
MFGPCFDRGLFFMITPLQPESTTDITQLIADAIPDHAWDQVRTAIVQRIVDEMPSDIMLKLTRSVDDFEYAELFLNTHYKEVPNVQLIVDAFSLIGPEQTTDLLDSLNIQESNGVSEGNPS